MRTRARAKNQTDLVHNFVTEGAEEGKSGSLLIHGDTLYNTELDAYLPIARRLGDVGDRVLIINSNEGFHHRNSDWQHELVHDDVMQFNHIHPDGQIVELIGYMQVTYKSVPNHPIKDLESLLGICERQKTNAIEKQAEALTEEEKEWCDKQITQADDIIWLIKDEIREKDFARQKNEIEELVKTPVILEQAIERGSIPSDQLQRIITTKNRVSETITQIDNYLSILMQIPAR